MPFDSESGQWVSTPFDRDQEDLYNNEAYGGSKSAKTFWSAAARDALDPRFQGTLPNFTPRNPGQPMPSFEQWQATSGYTGNEPEYAYLKSIFNISAADHGKLESFMRDYAPAIVGAIMTGGMAAAAQGGAVSGSVAAADAAGLAQMGMDAGLSGAALDSFVASGGTMGSTAAGGAFSVGQGSSSLVGDAGDSFIDSAYGELTNTTQSPLNNVASDMMPASQAAIDGSAQTIYDAAANAGLSGYDTALTSGVAGGGTAGSSIANAVSKFKLGDVKDLVAIIGGVSQISDSVARKKQLDDIMAQVQTQMGQSNPFDAGRQLALDEYLKVRANPQAFFQSPLATSIIGELSKQDRARQAAAGQTFGYDNSGNFRGSGIGGTDFERRLSTNMAGLYEGHLSNLATQAGANLFPNPGFGSTLSNLSGQMSSANAGRNAGIGLILGAGSNLFPELNNMWGDALSGMKRGIFGQQGA